MTDHDTPPRRFDVRPTVRSRVVDAVFAAIGVLTVVGCATAMAVCAYGLWTDRKAAREAEEWDVETKTHDVHDVYDSPASDPSNAVVLRGRTTSR